MSEKEKNPSNARLREIFAVLRKHKIQSGMTPQKLRLIMEDLGPTFIKLGQIVSMHADLLPKEYCEELSKLCTDVTSMPFDDVLAVIEESCGCPWKQIFSDIEERPQGSASIAQVHRAILRTGEQVVVKVQRRGIYEKMRQDILLLRKLVKWIPAETIKNMADLDRMLEELWAVSQEEMNFLTEAANMTEFARNNREDDLICIPRLYQQYTTVHLLVMEYVEGLAIDDKDALIKSGCDPKELGRRLADNYVRQIVEDGFFHADPHAGNIRVRDGKIVWMDMGMMGRLTENDRRMLTKGVTGIALNDTAMIEETVLALGEYEEKPDHRKLCDGIDVILQKYGHMDMGNLDLVGMLSDLMEILRQNQIRVPHSLTLLMRGMLHLEGVLADLSPDINIMEIAGSRMLHRAPDWEEIEKELKQAGRSALFSMRKTVNLPGYLTDLLKEILKGDAGVNMKIDLSKDTSQQIGSVVWDIVEGLWVMALIIGASIVCMADLKPLAGGMPIAAVVGYALAVLIVLRMFWRHRKKKS